MTLFLACYLVLTPQAYLLKSSGCLAPPRLERQGVLIGSRRTRRTFALFSSSRVNGYHNRSDDDGDDVAWLVSGVVPTLPQHVAFICDGNSRWAAARNLPAMAGHAAGADRLVHVLQDLRELQIPYCTMYAFSTENWKRPASEVRDLWSVIEATTRQFASHLLQEQIQLRVLGDLDDARVPESLRVLLIRLQAETALAAQGASNPQTLSVALNYGGRRDVVEAAKRLARMTVTGELNVDDITEAAFSQLMGTSDLPDPDLIVRTSGECRLSNFMLWNVAYAELYFTPCLWPDFDRDALRTALHWYTKRKRRFGSRLLDANAAPIDLAR